MIRPYDGLSCQLRTFMRIINTFAQQGICQTAGIAYQQNVSISRGCQIVAIGQGMAIRGGDAFPGDVN